MGLRHPTDTVSRIVPKTSLVEDDVLLALARDEFGHKPVRMPEIEAPKVDPNANPDYKEVYDSGFALPEGAEFSDLAVYAPNRWPDLPEGFETVISAYYRDAMAVARVLLRGLANALGQDDGYFDQHFDRPMALLRGNYYPERPDWAGEKDFGIAAHTDYGCLTLLGTDGVAGLEVLSGDDTWVPVSAKPGTFVINFGEMLEFWTEGQVKATLHRVKGTSETRISVPLFFNPNYETNVAPKGSDPIIAGEHLGKRFAETYLHMKAGKTGVLDYTFERYLAEGEPAGLSFIEWVESPAYDPDAIKADFRSQWWGNFFTERLLKRE